MLLAAYLAAACPAALPVEVTAFAQTRRYTIRVDTLGVLLPVPLPPDSVWERLPRIYEKMGMPLNENDKVHRRLGTCWRRVRGRMAGSSVSRYLDCGELRQMPNADRFDVDVLLLSAVREENGAVGVATLLLGWANDPGGSGRQWCQSRGTMEKKIQDEVMKGT